MWEEEEEEKEEEEGTNRCRVVGVVAEREE